MADSSFNFRNYAPVDVVGSTQIFTNIIDDAEDMSVEAAVEMMDGCVYYNGTAKKTLEFRADLAYDEVQDAKIWATNPQPHLVDVLEALGVNRLAAVRLWTADSVCYVVTSVLRDPKRTLATLRPILAFLKLYYGGLHRLPKRFVYIGPMFRAETGVRENFDLKMMIGRPFVFVSPTSFSSDPSVISNFMALDTDRTVYEVEEGVGYDISEISIYPEREVLVEGITVLEVAKVEKYDAKHKMVLMKQVNPGLHYVTCRIRCGVDMLSGSPVRQLEKEIIKRRPAADSAASRVAALSLGASSPSDAAASAAAGASLVSDESGSAAKVEAESEAKVEAATKEAAAKVEAEAAAKAASARVSGWSFSIKFKLEGHKGWVRGVAVSPDQKSVASASDDKTVIIWDVATGKIVRVLSGHGGYVFSVCWSPDGTKLASASGDKTVKIWNALTGELIETLKGHSNIVYSVSWSPDGTKLASGSEGETEDYEEFGELFIWDSLSGKKLMELKGHSKCVLSVSWSPDGTKLASGSFDNTIKIWNALTGELIMTLKGHSDTVRSVAWSPDGTKLASGSTDDTIKIWNALTGELIMTLSGHSNTVWSVDWSPDGTKIVSGSDDKSLIVWDITTAQQVVKLQEKGAVLSVAWEGSKIASGSTDRTVVVWGADT